MADLVLISFDNEIIDLIEQVGGHDIIGFTDVEEQQAYAGVRWLGDDSAWPELCRTRPGLRAVLAPDNPSLRARLTDRYGIDRLETIVSPGALVSPTATIGHGATIQAHVSIMSNAVLGRACKVHEGATIHHDCQVGDFCCIAGGARLLGYVTLEDRAYVGAGAIILPRRRIGRGAVIGAGAVVVHDVPGDTVVAGVPARPLSKKKTPSRQSSV
jgi:sugar O-acyltransferase (sialic acid O-acetyltransferase NeuD family)